MNQTQKKTKAERKKFIARVVCMAIAVVMVGTILFAAIFSQVY